MRGGRAEAPVPRSDISFRLDQKTGNFKVAILSRPMQWSVSPEEKQKNQLAQTVWLYRNNDNNKEGQVLVVPRLHVSVALQQKTANFKLALASRPMQWSAVVTEEKKKYELAA